MTKRSIRGVQDIKTLSGQVDEASIPYKAYMKLSVLEMEKYRRGQEKESALKRVRDIDQRFNDIEEEKRELLTALGAPRIQRRRLSDPEELPRAEAPRTTTGPFKIRY